MELTETWWYQLPSPFAHYEINDEGILRNTADGELVPTFTYWSMQGPMNEQVGEEMYALISDKDKCIGSYNSQELIQQYLDWSVFADHPEYEISKCGLLRTTIDKKPVPLQYTPRGTAYYEIPYDKNERPEEFILLTPFDLCDLSHQRKLFILNNCA